MYEDTIAAIATAPGEGGIGIVRISGSEAAAIAGRIFTRPDKLEPNRMVYGHIRSSVSGETVDEVMAVFMKEPHSYTGEDVVEIQCHGSIVSLRRILELVLENGARMAEPGEFTKRAFLNGRLDLSQAEAVIDLIRAKTDKTFDVALNQLRGKYSERIRELRQKLVDILVDITVNIDYPDEDIQILTYEKLSSDLRTVKDEVTELLSTADTGRIISEGLAVSIIGKPNVGKSSLMNALLRETRAIVTEIPGTTRDTIQEAVTIRGIPVRLTDTAGIRETEDIIEKIGIEKSKEAFNRADLIIFMLDNGAPLDDEDREIMSYIGDRRVIAAVNKSDLPRALNRDELRATLKNAVIIDISVKNGSGLEQIEEEVEKLVYGGRVRHGESPMVTNQRHRQLLSQAEASLNDALEMAEAGEPLELLEIDVNRAYELTGQIIGESVGEDVLNEVFSRFCLGK